MSEPVASSQGDSLTVNLTAWGGRECHLCGTRRDIMCPGCIHARISALEAERDSLRAALGEARTDAERYAFLKRNYHGADFDWGDARGIPCIVFKLPIGCRVSADVDATIDAARAALRGPSERGTET